MTPDRLTYQREYQRKFVAVNKGLSDFEVVRRVSGSDAEASERYAAFIKQKERIQRELTLPQNKD
jgi:hypothetical protein